jgi:hypothetical protein
MTAAILAAIQPFWQMIAAGLAALAVAGSLYWKGRSDARASAQKKDLEDANAIRKAGADARAADPADGVRDDGWRRD